MNFQGSDCEVSEAVRDLILSLSSKSYIERALPPSCPLLVKIDKLVSHEQTHSGDKGCDILSTIVFKFIEKCFPGLCSCNPWECLRPHEFSPPFNLAMYSGRRGVRAGGHITVTVSGTGETHNMRSIWLSKKVTLCNARSQHKGPTIAYSKPPKPAISRGPEWVKSNLSKSQSFIDRQQHLSIEKSKVLLQMRHSWTSHKCFVALSRTAIKHL